MTHYSVWGRRLVRYLSVEGRSFRGDYSGKLPEAVLDRLSAQGITDPNHLQRKCLDVLLDGSQEAAVINAETGSGKTFCFLLPILRLFSELWSSGGAIPSSSSLILVPTPHLGYQIQSLYRSLADPLWGSSISHHSAKLTLTPSTSLVIATPTSLVQYDLQRVLRHVRLLCVDEADALLTGSEKESTLTIMDTLRKNNDQTNKTEIPSTVSEPTDCSTREIFQTRFIFTAATLPSGGKQTVQSRLKRWLPKNTLHITTDNTHKLLPTAELRFVTIEATVTGDRERPKIASKRLNIAKRQQLIKDLCGLDTNQTPPKVLIFCNSVLSGEHLHRFLARPLPDLYNLTPPHWWSDKVGRLFKQEDGDVSSLEDTLKRFQTGALNVLVCSNLGCRGLDLRDVTAVIQYDFPGNVAEFIHRAGRTARAGRCGHVISYVDEESSGLANQIRDTSGGSMDRLFSRNKMLRRRLNRTVASEQQSVCV